MEFIFGIYHFIKVKYNDIYYVETDHVYIHIHTSAKKLTIRSSLGNFIENVNNDIFYRLHRSYLINMNHIDAINTDNVIVKGVKIPHAITINQGFELNFIMSDVKVNEGVTDADFK